MSLKKTLSAGLAAGLASGVVGALVLWLMLEPILARAIALEDTGGGHHDHGAHDHTEPLVSRAEQIVGGLVTVLVVGALTGLAFAIVYYKLGKRLPGAHPFSRSLLLAGLGFAAFALAPALVLPANPPGIGDPDTVTARTWLYAATVLAAVALVAACLAVGRITTWPAPVRGAAVCVLAVVGAGVMLWWLAPTDAATPEGFPADLLWDFRIASIVQLALMWLTRGVVFGWLTDTRTRSSRHTMLTRQPVG
ncbi:CbtA family protein [Rhodococcus koreensis]